MKNLNTKFNNTISASKLTKRAIAETSVEASPAEVSKALKEIFATVGITFRGENIDEKTHFTEVYATRGITIRSWGDNVKIEILEDGHGGSIIRAVSEATVPSTVVDYGQNKDDLERIFGMLANKYKTTSPLVIKEKIL